MTTSEPRESPILVLSPATGRRSVDLPWATSASPGIGQSFPGLVSVPFRQLFISYVSIVFYTNS